MIQVIPSQIPVKMFFDLDGSSTSVSSKLNIVKSVSWLTKTALVEMEILDDENASLAVSKEIILDASDESKLSLHVIYPNLVVSSIADAGALCRWINNYILSTELAEIDKGVMDYEPEYGARLVEKKIVQDEEDWVSIIDSKVCKLYD